MRFIRECFIVVITKANERGFKMFEVEVNNFDFEPIYSAQFENYTDAVKDFSNIVLSLTSSRPQFTKLNLNILYAAQPKPQYKTFNHRYKTFNYTRYIKL